MDGKSRPRQRSQSSRVLHRSTDCAFLTLSYAPAKHILLVADSIPLEREANRHLGMARGFVAQNGSAFVSSSIPDLTQRAFDLLHATRSFVVLLIRASMALTLFTNAFSRTPLP